MKPRRIIEKGLTALGCVDIQAQYVSPAGMVEYCPTWVVVAVVAEDIESGFIYDRECYEDVAT